MGEHGDNPTHPKARNLDHLFRGGSAPVAPTAMELGERLGRLRREVGYDAAELAERCGIAEADVIAFESDGSATAETLLALITRFSWSWKLDEAFRLPRLDSVDAMVDFERRHR